MKIESKSPLNKLFTTILDRYGHYLIGLSLGVFISGSAAVIWVQHYFLPSIQIEELPSETKYDSTLGEETIDQDLSPTPITTPQADSSTPMPTTIPKDVSQVGSLININNASQSEIETLPRIGPVIAQRIIQGRPYTTISEIQKVSGIGVKTYEQIKDKITVK